MQDLFRKLCLLPLAALLASCGGGSSDTGAAGGSGTPFTGPWFLIATINVNVAGTATFFTDTSRVVVGAGGNSVITETDSECSLNVFVNGDVLTYEARCVFTATSEETAAPCVLTIRSRAKIRGTPGDAELSGSFGPNTEVCRGAAASYAGNLVGSQTDPSAADMEEDNGNGTGTGTGTENGSDPATGRDEDTGETS